MHGLSSRGDMVSGMTMGRYGATPPSLRRRGGSIRNPPVRPPQTQRESLLFRMLLGEILALQWSRRDGPDGKSLGRTMRLPTKPCWLCAPWGVKGRRRSFLRCCIRTGRLLSSPEGKIPTSTSKRGLDFMAMPRPPSPSAHRERSAGRHGRFSDPRPHGKAWQPMDLKATRDYR
jgi:hypothetical protein